MAKNYKDRASTSFRPGGSDAAYIEPKLIPDFELLGRDDSGGPDFQPYNAQFGDGDYKYGAKAHLSPKGGSDDTLNGTEQESEGKARNADVDASRGAPASSRKMARK